MKKILIMIMLGLICILHGVSANHITVEEKRPMTLSDVKDIAVIGATQTKLLEKIESEYKNFTCVNKVNGDSSVLSECAGDEEKSPLVLIDFYFEGEKKVLSICDAVAVFSEPLFVDKIDEYYRKTMKAFDLQENDIAEGYDEQAADFAAAYVESGNEYAIRINDDLVVLIVKADKDENGFVTVRVLGAFNNG